jgi:AmiR/NasT family two-component response regulator
MIQGHFSGFCHRPNTSPEAADMSTLYLVDDHVIVREGMRALFEAAGFEVVGEAGDVAIAAADIALVPDVVLLDCWAITRAWICCACCSRTNHAHG